MNVTVVATTTTTTTPPPVTCVPVCGGVRTRGLANIGNTCYFNSAMQTLNQTQPLLSLLKRNNTNIIKLTRLIQQQQQQQGPVIGSVTRAFVKLLVEMPHTNSQHQQQQQQKRNSNWETIGRKKSGNDKSSRRGYGGCNPSQLLNQILSNTKRFTGSHSLIQ